MALVAPTPAARRRRVWTWWALAAVAAALGGLVLIARAPVVGVWLAFAGLVIAHWAGRRASDCAVLARLAQVPLSQVAATPARVVPRSATPIADVVRIRAASCGVVRVDDHDRVLPAARVDRFEVDVLLSGRWADLAVAAVALDGNTPVDRLTRLPNEDEVWLVRTAIATLVLGAGQLRAATRPVDLAVPRSTPRRWTSAARGPWRPRVTVNGHHP